VVDDEPMNRKLISKVLPPDRYRVVACGTAREAIALAASERPSVVLLDLGLPDQDGFAVANAIRGNPDIAFTPILALTGFTGAEIEQRLAEAGVEHYLPKPFRSAELYQATEKALASRAVRNASAEPAAAAG
jgi:CheY-like chemotaxis protein